MEGLAIRLFASLYWNPGGAGSLFFGNARQFLIQATGAGASIAYSLVVSLIILKIVDTVVGLRVNEENEILGLDLRQHSEIGYIQ